MKFKIKLSFMALLMIITLIYALPRYFPVLLISVFIHELGHILMALLLGVRIRSMRLDMLGALLDLDGNLFSYKREIFICLGGPLANALTSLVAYFFLPRNDIISLFIISSMALCVLNTLPIKSFDGGRICFAMLNIFFSLRTAERFIQASSFIIIISLWILSVYFLLKVGATLSLFVFSISFFAKIFLSFES